MNERIRKLAVQARQDFLKLPTGYTPEQVGMHPQLMEKFAELIVKECISALDEKIYRSIDGDGDEIWADLILKEHFGVEE
jgi:hypothetical protein